MLDSLRTNIFLNKFSLLVVIVILIIPETAISISEQRKAKRKHCKYKMPILLVLGSYYSGLKLCQDQNHKSVSPNFSFSLYVCFAVR